jgi:hypothetical protein
MTNLQPLDDPPNDLFSEPLPLNRFQKDPPVPNTQRAYPVRLAAITSFENDLRFVFGIATEGIDCIHPSIDPSNQISHI